MKVLIACEESQAVCKAFRERGHEAFSCDTQECSGGHPEWHIHDDVLKYINMEWDLIIAFPPCTYLSSVGNRWFNETRYGNKARERKRLRLEAMEFVKKIYDSPVKRISIENPRGWLNSHWKKPSQVLEPFYFGDPDRKRTCLWLKNLPPLFSTIIDTPKVYGVLKSGKNKGKAIYFTESKGMVKDRAKIRSKTFPGIADAMAKQWGNL